MLEARWATADEATCARAEEAVLITAFDAIAEEARCRSQYASYSALVTNTGGVNGTGDACLIKLSPKSET